MKRIFVLLAVLLFGCIGSGDDIAANVTNITNTTINTSLPSASVPPANAGMAVGNVNTGITNDTVAVVAGMNYTNSPLHWFEVYFIYVGQLMPESSQGDAILLKRGDLDILIDGGPNGSSDALLNFLKARNVDDIDLLISTNSDPRNFGALPGLAGKMRVEEFWYSGMDHGNAQYSDFVQNMKDKVSYYRTVRTGNKITANDITVTILNPPVGNGFGNVYDDAIVTKVEFGKNFSLLLTSSIHDKAQQELLKYRKKELNATVMQAPYYGLPPGTENATQFVKAVDPLLVVFTGCIDDSVGQGGSRVPFRDYLNSRGSYWYEIYNGSSLKIWTNGFEFFGNYTK